MDQRDAEAISRWRYDEPYSFYDWTADEDDLALLLDPRARDGRFFSAYGDGELVGFFELRVESGDVVVGLGLRPDLTGRGLGRGFLESGLAFARELFGERRFRLSVATFNERAIRVYERCGFVRGRVYLHHTNGGIHEFLEMTREA
jgi:ribosomal-protein-alanine N-acetyltransferase